MDVQQLLSTGGKLRQAQCWRPVVRISRNSNVSKCSSAYMIIIVGMSRQGPAYHRRARTSRAGHRCQVSHYHCHRSESVSEWMTAHTWGLCTRKFKCPSSGLLFLPCCPLFGGASMLSLDLCTPKRARVSYTQSSRPTTRLQFGGHSLVAEFEERTTTIQRQTAGCKDGCWDQLLRHNPTQPMLTCSVL